MSVISYLLLLKDVLQAYNRENVDSLRVELTVCVRSILAEGISAIITLYIYIVIFSTDQ